MNTRPNLLIAFLLLISCSAPKGLESSNTNDDLEKYIKEVTQFQIRLNKEYLDPEKSPLDTEQMVEFKAEGGHDFFGIDPSYKIVAPLDASMIKKNIGFKTSTERIAMYDRIGIVKFAINSETYQLSVYESHYLRNNPEYKNHLFLPFNDLSNGKSTYGGGRYIDVKRLNDNKLVIDFNKSYNPYCAYSSNYSCPVPPKENFLNFEVNAGIKQKMN